MAHRLSRTPDLIVLAIMQTYACFVLSAPVIDHRLRGKIYVYLIDSTFIKPPESSSDEPQNMYNVEIFKESNQTLFCFNQARTQLTAEAHFPRNNPLISGINDFLESPPVSQLPTAKQ